MISLRFGTRFWGSDIVRERFKDLGFRTSERDFVRETEWFEYYEAGESQVFKLFYL